ncbi:MAG: serine hydrolase [Alphaproteobacteria bacterium]|nr:serine hydrolase [Alphaproteobacteria bacterium]
MGSEAVISGWVAPGFAVVEDAFAANFHREEPESELGAALAVYFEGRCVVDLWGGFTDTARTRPWARDTLVNVWSASKGITALAVAILVDQGAASYDDPVAKHWPEFAANGKEAITLGQILSHQSGLNGWEAPTTWDDLYNWRTATSRLAAQAPAWEPGTLASYHAITHGYLAGEVVRRITGQHPGPFIRDAIATPLGADFHVGLPAAHDWRVAEMLPPPPANATPGGPGLPEIARRAVTNPVADPALPNTRAWREAEIPAANGQASAQGLARIYGALAHGGTLDGIRIISPEGIDRMRAPRHLGPDQMVGPRYWGAGVSSNVAPAFGPHADTFGHTGWGGAFGCANTRRQVGIGYVMNRMGGQIASNPRGTSLAAAVFAALGD